MYIRQFVGFGMLIVHAWHLSSHVAEVSIGCCCMASESAVFLLDAAVIEADCFTAEIDMACLISMLCIGRTDSSNTASPPNFCFTSVSPCLQKQTVWCIDRRLTRSWILQSTNSIYAFTGWKNAFINHIRRALLWKQELLSHLRPQELSILSYTSHFSCFQAAFRAYHITTILC